jgi:hypothetical protein
MQAARPRRSSVPQCRWLPRSRAAHLGAFRPDLDRANKRISLRSGVMQTCSAMQGKEEKRTATKPPGTAVLRVFYARADGKCQVRHVCHRKAAVQCPNWCCVLRVFLDIMQAVLLIKHSLCCLEWPPGAPNSMTACAGLGAAYLGRRCCARDVLDAGYDSDRVWCLCYAAVLQHVSNLSSNLMRRLLEMTPSEFQMPTVAPSRPVVHCSLH